MYTERRLTIFVSLGQTHVKHGLTKFKHGPSMRFYKLEAYTEHLLTLQNRDDQARVLKFIFLFYIIALKKLGAGSLKHGHL
jgi:hypothetical protein